MGTVTAKYTIGHIVRHRVFPFRGVVFDIDPQFDNSEEWYESIPLEVRPHKEQPFYHLFAVGESGPYIAYVSEQNLVADEENGPVDHPALNEYFEGLEDGCYILRPGHAH